MIKALYGIGATLLVASAAVPASATTFKKLTDTSLIGPDKQPVFTLSTPQLAGSKVVFMGATGTPNVYLYAQSIAGGKPLVLVSNKSKVPGGSGTFTGSFAGYFTTFQPPNCTPPVIGTTKAVFVGRDAANHEGIYSVPLVGGKITKLVDYNTLIPGQPVLGYSKFNVNYSFCNLSISGETVVFDAGGGGVYTVGTDGKGLARIADPNTPATYKTFMVNGYAQPNIKGRTVTYIGSTVFGPFAVFVNAPKIANARAFSTSKPEFAQFSYPILEGNSILFSAKETDPNQGLFSVPATGGAVSKVVDQGTRIPKGTPGKTFASVGSVISNIGWSPVTSKFNVFAAETTDGTNSFAGLFSRCNNTVTKLLAQGDKLGGVEVTATSGVNYLAPVAAAGKVTSYRGALLVGGFRYAAIYTMAIQAC